MTKSKKPKKKKRAPIQDETIQLKTGISAGFDPGTLSGAFCAVDQHGKIVFQRAIKNPPGTELLTACRIAADIFTELCSEYVPDVLVIERPWLFKNPAVQFKLDVVVGYMASVAHAKHVPIVIVHVDEARKRVGDKRPTCKGTEKDIYDANTFARYGQTILRPMPEPIEQN